MAIVCDFYGIYLSKPTINKKYPGGIKEFLKNYSPHLQDDNLVCFTVMNPSDADFILEQIKRDGFNLSPDKPDSDVAVVAQPFGPNTDYEWLEFGEVDEFRLFACWLKGTAPGYVFCPPYME